MSSYRTLMLCCAIGIFTHSPATATPIRHQCGAVISSEIITNVTNFTIRSTSFVNIRGAQAKVFVPAGHTRCVKVRFSMEGRCAPNPGGRCGVKVDDGGQLFDPAQDGILFSTDRDNWAVYSYEWVKRLSEGTHILVMQGIVADTANQFDFINWTMTFEQSK